MGATHLALWLHCVTKLPGSSISRYPVGMEGADLVREHWDHMASVSCASQDRLSVRYARIRADGFLLAGTRIDCASFGLEGAGKLRRRELFALPDTVVLGAFIQHSQAFSARI